MWLRWTVTCRSWWPACCLLKLCLGLQGKHLHGHQQNWDLALSVALRTLWMCCLKDFGADFIVRCTRVSKIKITPTLGAVLRFCKRAAWFIYNIFARADAHGLLISHFSFCSSWFFATAPWTVWIFVLYSRDKTCLGLVSLNASFAVVKILRNV